MAEHSLGIKYVEVETPKGKVKVILLQLDGEMVTEAPAKEFYKWLSEKVREMGEWLDTGKVQKWHKYKPLKTDKDKLRYVG